MSLHLDHEQCSHYAFQLRRLLENPDPHANLIAFEEIRRLCLMLEERAPDGERE